MQAYKYLNTLFIIFCYCIISSLFLMNRNGGADIIFFFLINISFLVHIIYNLFKVVFCLFKNRLKPFTYFLDFLLVLIVYILFILLFKFQIIP